VRHFTHQPKSAFSYDLHVLSTPPAFVLSQDQTLQFKPSRNSTCTSRPVPEVLDLPMRVVPLFVTTPGPSRDGRGIALSRNISKPLNFVKSSILIARSDRTLFSFQRSSKTQRSLYRTLGVGSAIISASGDEEVVSSPGGVNYERCRGRSRAICMPAAKRMPSRPSHTRCPRPSGPKHLSDSKIAYNNNGLS
jgi:hypothetical protein